MDKEECLNLIADYFRLESYIASLKNPDFKLKSHIFYFRDIFKDVPEIKILKVVSKNPQDNILFDIYYESKEFSGLFHGFFRIKPESDAAEKIFQNISKVCTDLAEYFYYVYQSSDLLKIYMISGSLQNALEQYGDKNFLTGFDEIRRKTFSNIAGYSAEQFNSLVLYRRLNEKYIANFINFNSKCSETVRMFLISILSSGYSNYICMVNRVRDFKHYVNVNPAHATFNSYPGIPVYGLLDYIVEHSFVLFVYLEFDFEGGVNIGKTVNQR